MRLAMEMRVFGAHGTITTIRTARQPIATKFDANLQTRQAKSFWGKVVTDRSAFAIFRR
jgi:hypothetical protein